MVTTQGARGNQLSGSAGGNQTKAANATQGVVRAQSEGFVGKGQR